MTLVNGNDRGRRGPFLARQFETLSSAGGDEYDARRG
jgi:hypothetical protein